MFRASPCPLSGACNYIKSLWFYRWSVGVSSAVGRDQITTNNTAMTNTPTVKPEAVNAVASS